MIFPAHFMVPSDHSLLWNNFVAVQGCDMKKGSSAYPGCFINKIVPIQ